MPELSGEVGDNLPGLRRLHFDSWAFVNPVCVFYQRNIYFFCSGVIFLPLRRSGKRAKKKNKKISISENRKKNGMESSNNY